MKTTIPHLAILLLSFIAGIIGMFLFFADHASLSTLILSKICGAALLWATARMYRDSIKSLQHSKKKH